MVLEGWPHRSVVVWPWDYGPRATALSRQRDSQRLGDTCPIGRIGLHKMLHLTLLNRALSCMQMTRQIRYQASLFISLQHPPQQACLLKIVGFAGRWIRGTPGRPMQRKWHLTCFRYSYRTTIAVGLAIRTRATIAIDAHGAIALVVGHRHDWAIDRQLSEVRAQAIASRSGYENNRPCSSLSGETSTPGTRFAGLTAACSISA